MASAVLDANFILRYMLGDVPDQAAVASAIMNKIEAGELAASVPDFVLTECIYVLDRRYHLPRDQIADWFRNLFALEGMRSHDLGNVLDALSIFETSNFSIVDALLAAQVRTDQSELHSFDKQLLKFVARR